MRKLFNNEDKMANLQAKMLESPEYKHLISDISNVRIAIGNTTNTSQLTKLKYKLGELLHIKTFYDAPWLFVQALEDPALI